MNFIYCFQSEWLKKKRSMASWLVFIGAFFIPAVILTARIIFNNKLPQENTSKNFWEVFWSKSWEPMVVLLLPLGIILFTSLITQLEFKNNTWKQLHTTPQTLTLIFFTKFAVIVVMLVQFFILFNVGIYLAAIIPHLIASEGTYPRESVACLFFFKENINYFIATLPILALQYLLSLYFKNFLIPIGVGVAIWMVSLLVNTWKYAYVVPYVYCRLNHLKGLGAYDQPAIYLLAIGYFMVFTLAGYVLYVTKKEKG